MFQLGISAGSVTRPWGFPDNTPCSFAKDALLGSKNVNIEFTIYGQKQAHLLRAMHVESQLFLILSLPSLLPLHLFSVLPVHWSTHLVNTWEACSGEDLLLISQSVNKHSSNLIWSSKMRAAYRDTGTYLSIDSIRRWESSAASLFLRMLCRVFSGYV